MLVTTYDEQVPYAVACAYSELPRRGNQKSVLSYAELRLGLGRYPEQRSRAQPPVLVELAAD
jgi:hypothetical protein